MRTIVRARWVLGHRDGDHVLHEHAEVVVVDGVVQEVRSATGALTPVTADAGPTELVDLGDAVVLPGLIDLDALSDIDHAILDSWHAPENAARLQWSERHAHTPHGHVLTPDERGTMRRFAFAQLLLHGVTTAMPIASEIHSSWAESFDDAVQMTHEAERLGLRAYIGPSYRSSVPVLQEDGTISLYSDDTLGAEGLADAIRFVEWVRARRSPLVQPVLLPCRIETLSNELLDGTARAASELDVRVRLHALQGLEELRLLRERGTTSLDLLDEHGLLSDRLLIPHGLYTDMHPRVADTGGGGTLARLVASGATVIHCPLTSAHYAAALHSFDDYRRAGVPIALGTDSFPPDMLRGIDMGSSIAKIIAGRTDAGTHADYVRAATVGGAAALGRSDLGRLAPGAQADLIAVRLDDVRDGVIDDPIRTMVQHTTARAVDFSMIAGRVVVSGGALVGEDMRALREEAQTIFAKLRAGYAQRTQIPTTEDDLFPPSFARA